MSVSPQSALSVALLAEGRQRSQLRALLHRHGVRIVREDSLPIAGCSFEGGEEDVLLVGLDDRFDESAVCGLLDQVQSPVLLNQGGVGCSLVWKRQFMDKLHQLAGRETSVQGAPARNYHPELHIVGQAVTDSDHGSHHVVILGASIGGPKAVSAFLKSLPQKLPVTFLLAQRISSSYQQLLVDQLNRCSSWVVSSLQGEQQMLPGQVWLIPPDQQIAVSQDGKIKPRSQPLDSACRPNISSLMEKVAQTCGTRSGAIIFSGLGKDGSSGCEMILRHGGFVWTQERESCVNAKLPEAVRRKCRVEYSGTPEELAEALAKKYQTKVITLN